jgi:hypothetical protein
VSEWASEIPVRYCTKVTTNDGADVVRVEPDGDGPSRAWVGSALFDCRNASKESMTAPGELFERADGVAASGLERAHELTRVGRPRPALVSVRLFGCADSRAMLPTFNQLLEAVSWGAFDNGTEALALVDVACGDVLDLRPPRATRAGIELVGDVGR